VKTLLDRLGVSELSETPKRLLVCPRPPFRQSVDKEEPEPCVALGGRAAGGKPRRLCLQHFSSFTAKKSELVLYISLQ